MKGLLEKTPTTASDYSSSNFPAFALSHKPAASWKIKCDQFWMAICVVAVKLCIACHHVPLVNDLLRRLTLMSGSFDTNAMLCLFLRYLYTFMPGSMAFDSTERVFAHLFLERQYFIFAWVATSVTMRLLPPLIRPLYRSYYGRARFAAEFVERCLRERQVKQLVVLGAGFDSTAYRTASLRKAQGGVKVFEVDLPRVQRKKLEYMRRGLSKEQLAFYQSDVVYVECNFGKDDLIQRLRQYGYDPSLHTAILWEGVTYYLNRDALESTFRELEELANIHRQTEHATKVWMFLDYMLQNETVTKGHHGSDEVWKLNVQQAEALGTAFVTGFSDIYYELAKFGIRVIKHITFDEIETNYFSPKTVPEKLSVFVEANTTFGHNEPYLNLAECVFE